MGAAQQQHVVFGSDGKSYAPDRLLLNYDGLQWFQRWARTLGHDHMSELGLLAALWSRWPQACAVSDSGQESLFFLADFDWDDVHPIIEPRQAECIALLQRLENLGAIWIIRRGSQIECLEPRNR